MKRAKIVFLILALSLSSFSARSQWDGGRWVLGGTMGFGFTNTQTALNISPQIGYRVTESLTLGGGPIYAFYRYRQIDTQSNFLGVNAFARISPIPYVQFFVQPELFRRWGRTRGVRDSGVVFGTLLVGGGMLFPVARGGVMISLFYDVIGGRHSPYRRELMYSVGYSYYF